MNSRTAIAAPVTGASRSDAPLRKAWAASFLLLGILWLLLIRQLSGEWSVNPQYAFGWGMPLLTAYLWLKRWEDRPSPIPAPFSPICSVLAGLGLILLLPLAVVREANPDWRLLSWIYAIVVVGLTLELVRYSGGGRWARHFLPPLAFFLLAVPWPTFIEKNVIQSLTSLVAAVTVEVLNWSGFAVWRQGNVLRLPNGYVGIDEACSGLRSFQGALMAGFFLGEWLRLSRHRRIALVAWGAALAVGFNLVRACFLAWLTARKGTDALDQWHDSAGYTILVLCFISLWLISRRWAAPSAPHSPPSLPARPFPLKWTAVAVAMLVAAQAGTFLWYRSPNLGDATAWSLQLPDKGPRIVENPVSDLIRASFRYDEGESLVWTRDDGSRWTIFYFRWHPGAPAAALRAKSHSPELCLPAVGLDLIEQKRDTFLLPGNFSLPVRAYEFRRGAEPYYVFFFFWEEGTATPAAAEEVLRSIGTVNFDPAARFEAVKTRKRAPGMQLLEIVVSGVPTYARAREQLAAFLVDNIAVALHSRAE